MDFYCIKSHKLDLNYTSHNIIIYNCTHPDCWIEYTKNRKEYFYCATSKMDVSRYQLVFSIDYSLWEYHLDYNDLGIIVNAGWISKK